MLGYVRLVRLPNVFTALSNAISGFTIISALQGGAPYSALYKVMAASACLYLAGMAFNDVADEKLDAEERPTRPIPSGAVSYTGAVVCGIVLMLAGIGFAAWAGGFCDFRQNASLMYAVSLSGAILKYDFAGKRNALIGPLVLGLCRFLNVQLAMTASIYFASAWANSRFWQPFWAAPLAVGIYAAGLTAFSKQEEAGHQRRAILLGWFFCGSGVLIAGATGQKIAWIALLPLSLVLMHLTRRLQKLKSPEAARDLVRAGVMGICVLDAGLILAFAGPDAWPFALGCVALLAPGLLVAKLIKQREA